MARLRFGAIDTGIGVMNATVLIGGDRRWA